MSLYFPEKMEIFLDVLELDILNMYCKSDDVHKIAEPITQNRYNFHTSIYELY